MEGMTSSIQQLDRLFADHFSAAPVMKDPAVAEKARSSSSSFDSSNESDGPHTPSYSGSVDSLRSQKEQLTETERAAKLKMLYSTLAELYVDQQPPVWNSPASNKSISSWEAIKAGEHVFQKRRTSVSFRRKSSVAFINTAAASAFQEDDKEYIEDTSPAVSTPSSKSKRTPTLGKIPGFAELMAASNWTAEKDVGQKMTMSRSQSQNQIQNLSQGLRESKSESTLREQTINKRHVQAESIPPATPSIDVAPPPGISGLQEIVFKIDVLPNEVISEDGAKDILCKSFPNLCELPTRMYGENGEPLPPTKKEETSPEERKARKAALAVQIRGKKSHSIIKSGVILESRSTSWKRIGSAKLTEAAYQPLPSLPDPWSLECYHQDLDKVHTDGKAKRSFEFKDNRVEGLCMTCSGRGLEPCSTCKGDEADECWWCTGTGKKKNLRACERCLGEGKLKCQTCAGRLVSSCHCCQGEGHGLYAAIVNIKVRRVDFPSVPIAAVVADANYEDPDVVQEMAVHRTKELIDRLISSSDARGKTSFRPLTASCSWEVSFSTLIEVEVPQSTKHLSRKPSKSSLGSGLRRQMSNNTLKNKKGTTAIRYFMIPSASDLRPAEFSREEFNDALLPEMPRRKVVDLAHSSLPPSPTASTPPVSHRYKSRASPLAQTPTTPAGHSPYKSADNTSPSYFDSMTPYRPVRSDMRNHRRTGSTPMPPVLLHTPPIRP